MNLTLNELFESAFLLIAAEVIKFTFKKITNLCFEYLTLDSYWCIVSVSVFPCNHEPRLPKISNFSRLLIDQPPVAVSSLANF